MAARTHIIRRNVQLLYVINFFTDANFTLPINILFGHQFLGLNYFQAGSLYFVPWFASIAFDFFGGNVADKIGRKQAFLYGIALQVITLAPFLITKSFTVLLVSSLLNGISQALSSNCIEALLYEQFDTYGTKQSFLHANSLTQVTVFLGRICASLLGGLTFYLNPRLPYLLYMVALTIAFWAGARIQVLPTAVKATAQKYQAIVASTLRIYRQHTELITFVTICTLFALWSDMLYGYYQPLFITWHVSSVGLGFLFAAISFGSAYGAHLMRTLPNRFSAHTIQSLELLGVIATSVLLMVLKLPAAFAAPMTMSVVSGFMNPNMRLFINHHTPNTVRVSVLSLTTTLISTGSSIGLVCAVYMADHLAPKVVLSIIAIGTICSLLLNLVMHRPVLKSMAPGRDK